jgi:hypothetical protein
MFVLEDEIGLCCMDNDIATHLHMVQWYNKKLMYLTGLYLP